MADNDNNKPVPRPATVLFLQPRGLNRVVAASYIGVSPSKFDHMVADRRMPRPKQVDGRRVWDRLALDIAFESLAEVPGANGCDAVL